MVNLSTYLDEVLEKFQYHSSTKQIRENFISNKKSYFMEVTEDQVRKEILHLHGSKATSVGDRPIDILKLTGDVHLSAITKVIKLSLRNGCFPSYLKSADTAQKIKFFLKDFFSKYDQIRSFLRIWSHLLKKSLMENFIFCAVRNQAKSE